MITLVHEFFTGQITVLQEAIVSFWDTVEYVVFQIKSYVNPTASQRLGVDWVYNREFAYQKAEARFDNYPIRAIIRDEYILNGQQGRPQRHPF